MTTSDKPTTCEACRFWDILGNGTCGECRRLSPKRARGGWDGRWPETGANDWCGEGAPREAASQPTLPLP